MVSEANLETVRRFFEVGFGNDARLGLWAEDAVIEYPLMPEAGTVTGAKAIAERARKSAALVTDFVYRDLRIHPGADPELFFVMGTSAETVIATGERRERAFFNVFRVRAGRILRRIEYVRVPPR